MEKVGFSWAEFVKSPIIKEIAQRPIMSAVGLAGLATLTKELIVDPIMEKSKINKSFEEMTQKVPQLAEKDQDQLRDYFDVVKTYSPRAASNPLVAGALVNKMMEFGGVDHKLVQDIGAIEANKETPNMTAKMLESATGAAITGAVKSEFKTDDSATTPKIHAWNQNY